MRKGMKKKTKPKRPPRVEAGVGVDPAKKGATGKAKGKGKGTTTKKTAVEKTTGQKFKEQSAQGVREKQAFEQIEKARSQKADTAREKRQAAQEAQKAKDEAGFKEIERIRAREADEEREARQEKIPVKKIVGKSRGQGENLSKGFSKR